MSESEDIYSSASDNETQLNQVPSNIPKKLNLVEMCCEYLDDRPNDESLFKEIFTILQAVFEDVPAADFRRFITKIRLGFDRILKARSLIASCDCATVSNHLLELESKV
jgi:hypothetical protein